MPRGGQGEGRESKLGKDLSSTRQRSCCCCQGLSGSRGWGSGGDGSQWQPFWGHGARRREDRKGRCPEDSKISPPGSMGTRSQTCPVISHPHPQSRAGLHAAVIWEVSPPTRCGTGRAWPVIPVLPSLSSQTAAQRCRDRGQPASRTPDRTSTPKAAETRSGTRRPGGRAE